MSNSNSNICHQCFTIFQNQDRYCGNCGHKLFSLTWKLVEPTYKKDESTEIFLERSKNDIIVAVSDESSAELTLIAENNGRVPLAICIPDIPTEFTLPDWIQKESINLYKQQVVTISPGNRYTFIFKINTSILSDVMSLLESNPDQDQQKNKCIIPIYTSSVEEKNKLFITEVNRLLLSPARAPYVTPNTCILRFLSWEQLAHIHKTKPSLFPVSFEIHNHQNHAIEIDNISFEDQMTTEYKDLGITFPVESDKIQQVSFVRAQELFDDFMSEKIVIPSRSTRTIQLKLHPQLNIFLESLDEVVKDLSSEGREIKKKPLRRFASLICLHAKTMYSNKSPERREEEEKAITFYIAGLIGHAPFFHLGEEEKIKNEDVIHPAEINEGIKKISFQNFGHMPIMIHKVDILKDHSSIPNQREIIQQNDWLRYNNRKGTEGALYPQMIIPPFSKGSFSLEIDPNTRTEEELNQKVLRRYFRIHHSSSYSAINNEISYTTQLSLEAKLGTVYNGDNLVLAIDFGTTNSVAYLSKPIQDTDQPNKCIIVPLEGGLQHTETKTTLPSLLLYDSGYAFGDKYITGTLAENQSALNPDNFVRSIKSVLNKNSQEVFYFMKKNGPNEKLVEQTAQQLLNAFILDIKTRAELEFCRCQLHEKLGFSETHTKIKHAVFTHPVDISDESKQALLIASHNAGLNLDLKDLETFEDKALLDESSAALISFYHFLLESGEYARNQAQFLKSKILCIDIGGGTTDISVVSFQGDNLQNAKLMIETPIGFQFGGDDIDKMISDHWIKKYGFSAEDVRTCAMVWNSYSYSDYENKFLKTLTNKKLTRSDKRTIVRNNYDTANQIRKIAIQAKIALAAGITKSFEDEVKSFDKKELTLNLSQEEFSSLLNPTLNTILEKVNILLQRLSWKYQDLTYVVFTGQTNRIFEIQRFMRQYFPETTNFYGCFGDNPFEPKNCVAEGASMKNSEIVKVLFPKDRNVLECNLWTNATSAKYGDPPIASINTPLPLSIPIQNHSGAKFYLFTDKGIKFMEFQVPEGRNSFIIQLNSMSQIGLI